MSMNSLDRLFAKALEKRGVRAARDENALRRALATAFEDVRTARGLSLRDLAAEMETSLSQVQRVLNKNQGGSLTLNTVCRAADALDLRLSIQVEPLDRIQARRNFSPEDSYSYRQASSLIAKRPGGITAKSVVPNVVKENGYEWTKAPVKTKIPEAVS